MPMTDDNFLQLIDTLQSDQVNPRSGGTCLYVSPFDAEDRPERQAPRCLVGQFLGVSDADLSSYEGESAHTVTTDLAGSKLTWRQREMLSELQRLADQEQHTHASAIRAADYTNLGA